MGAEKTPSKDRFLPPGPGGEEGGKRAPGSRWPADPWGDDPYWKTEDKPKEEKK